MLSIAPHRSVDLASPRFGAAVEVDGVAKPAFRRKSTTI
jgi:hypothetical protein